MQVDQIAICEVFYPRNRLNLIGFNHAKITYASNKNRDFNEYVNVSDILDQFMKYASDLKLTRAQFLALPIQTFLMWLIIEAAKKDGEPPPEGEVKQLELALKCG